MTADNRVIANQSSDYSALRAAYGGCAMYAPAGAVVWRSVLFVAHRATRPRESYVCQRHTQAKDLQGMRIATPVCALARNDSIAWQQARFHQPLLERQKGGFRGRKTAENHRLHPPLSRLWRQFSSKGASGQGTLCHFPNYTEYFQKSKPYVFAKSGENCLRKEKNFCESEKKQKKFRKIPLSLSKKRGIV